MAEIILDIGVKNPFKITQIHANVDYNPWTYFFTCDSIH